MWLDNLLGWCNSKIKVNASGWVVLPVAFFAIGFIMPLWIFRLACRQLWNDFKWSFVTNFSRWEFCDYLDHDERKGLSSWLRDCDTGMWQVWCGPWKILIRSQGR